MLEKLAIRYDGAEDRLVLTLQFGGAAGSERRTLLLTRRVCAGWRADLSAMLSLAAAEPQSAYATQPAPARKLKPDAAEGDAPPEPQARQPAGAEPPAGAEADLVTRIGCARRRSDGRWILKFQTRGQAPFSLLLSDQALSDLNQALTRQLGQAQWALPPLAEPAAAAPRRQGSALH